MAQKLPIDFVAEFRGQKPAGSFIKRETGEKIDIPARLKFELTRDDGDVEVVEVTATQLDKVTPPFDYAKLKRGDMVSVKGDVILMERGSERDSYFTVTTVATVDAAAMRLRQAA